MKIRLKDLREVWDYPSGSEWDNSQKIPYGYGLSIVEGIGTIRVDGFNREERI